MSFGKLRFSWGQNGNRSLANPYIALADLGSGTGGTYGYVDASGNTTEYRYFTMNRLANTHLQWEKIHLGTFRMPIENEQGKV